MANIYYDKDIELDSIDELTFAVIGYGNQGRAHALNLRDSGISVRVGARAGGNAESQAKKDGFEPETIESAVTNSDAIVLLVPDDKMSDIYGNVIEPYLAADKVFVFAHGFALEHQLLRLPEYSDVILVAPTGPGKKLRELYVAGRGLPALAAVAQDASGLARKRCLAYGKAIGSGRAGIIETTVREETVVDLYCEQAVLCGGLPDLIKRSFDVLVENGYQPELAYISCLKEVKLIADLLFSRGMDGMRSAISTTAQYGSSVSAPILFDSGFDTRLQRVLTQIEDGTFAKRFIGDTKNDSVELNHFLKEERRSRLVKTGNALDEILDFRD